MRLAGKVFGDCCRLATSSKDVLALSYGKLLFCRTLQIVSLVFLLLLFGPPVALVRNNFLHVYTIDLSHIWTNERTHTHTHTPDRAHSKHQNSRPKISGTVFGGLFAFYRWFPINFTSVSMYDLFHCHIINTHWATFSTHSLTHTHASTWPTIGK